MTEEKHDVVIVGAGIAGLLCANYLISAGKKVLLLEHNHQAGGLMGGFRRKGFYFDAGDQSFEQSNIVFPMLKELGLFQPEEWEFSDFKLQLPQGSVAFKNKPAFVKGCADLFPNHRSQVTEFFNGLNGYVEVMEGLLKYYPNILFSKGFPRIQGIVGLIKTIRKNQDAFNEVFYTSTAEYVDQCFPGNDFKTKVGQMGYRNMPLFMGMGLWHSTFKDYWYPRTGLQGLMDKLVDRFKRLGGQVQFKQTVKEILLKQNKAVGVLTNNNDVFHGSWIVFAGSTQRLYTEYLPASVLDPALVQKVKTGKLSESMNTVYLGLDMSSSELRKHLDTHHTIYMSNEMFKNFDNFEDKNLHQNTFLEFSCPSLRNPNLAPEGKNVLILQTNSAYKWMNNWGTGGDDFKRSAKYKQLKKKVTEEMIDTAEKVVPNLRDRIVFQDIGTPLSTIRFTLNPEGATGGWTYDHEHTVLKDKYLDLFTPIRRLLAIGHYAIWPGGVPFAALSGWMGAKAIEKGQYISPAQDLKWLFKQSRT